MKRLLTTAFILAALAAHAQAVTLQSLQGRWELVYLQSPQMTIDVVNRTFILSEQTTAGLDSIRLVRTYESVSDMVEGMEARIAFNEDVMTQEYRKEGKMVTETIQFTYKAGTPPTLEGIAPDGEKITLEVTFTQGDMVLVEPTKKTKVIYKKLNN